MKLTVETLRPGDIVRQKDTPEHVGRVCAVFDDRVRVRWGEIRRIADAAAADLEVIIRRAAMLDRMIAYGRLT